MVGDLPPAGRRKGAGDGSGDGMTEKFRGSVSEWPRAVLDWLCGDREDYRALQRRKVSSAHRKRRGICRGLWIVSGGLMVVYAELSVIVGLGLVTVFLCFAVLEEQ